MNGDTAAVSSFALDALLRRMTSSAEAEAESNQYPGQVAQVPSIRTSSNVHVWSALRRHQSAPVWSRATAAGCASSGEADIDDDLSHRQQQQQHQQQQHEYDPPLSLHGSSPLRPPPTALSPTKRCRDLPSTHRVAQLALSPPPPSALPISTRARRTSSSVVSRSMTIDDRPSSVAARTRSWTTRSPAATMTTKRQPVSSDGVHVVGRLSSSAKRARASHTSVAALHLEMEDIEDDHPSGDTDDAASAASVTTTVAEQAPLVTPAHAAIRQLMIDLDGLLLIDRQHQNASTVPPQTPLAQPHITPVASHSLASDMASDSDISTTSPTIPTRRHVSAENDKTNIERTSDLATHTIDDNVDNDGRADDTDDVVGMLRGMDLCDRDLIVVHGASYEDHPVVSHGK